MRDASEGDGDASGDGDVGTEDAGGDGDVGTEDAGRDAGPEHEYPAGKLSSCSGQCPSGACEQFKPFTEEPPCRGTYPERVDSEFPFCPPQFVGDYCLRTVESSSTSSNSIEHALVVRCGAQASLEPCADDCGSVTRPSGRRGLGCL